MRKPTRNILNRLARESETAASPEIIETSGKQARALRSQSSPHDMHGKTGINDISTKKHARKQGKVAKRHGTSNIAFGPIVKLEFPLDITKIQDGNGTSDLTTPTTSPITTPNNKVAASTIEPASHLVGRIVELIERILFYMPLTSIIIASCVNKQWHSIIATSSVVAPHIFRTAWSTEQTPTQLEQTRVGRHDKKYFFKTKLFQLRQWHPTLFQILEIRKHYPGGFSEVTKRGDRLEAYGKFAGMKGGSYEEALICQPPYTQVRFVNKDMHGVVVIIRAPSDRDGITVRQVQTLATSFAANAKELTRRRLEGDAIVKWAAKQPTLYDLGSPEWKDAHHGLNMARRDRFHNEGLWNVLDQQMKSFENGFIQEGFYWERPDPDDVKRDVKRDTRRDARRSGRSG